MFIVSCNIIYLERAHSSRLKRLRLGKQHARHSAGQKDLTKSFIHGKTSSIKEEAGNKSTNPREQKLNYTNQDNTRTQAANAAKNYKDKTGVETNKRSTNAGGKKHTKTGSGK